MSAAEMREALKPCPFCGGEASKVTTFTGAFWFQCRGCGAQGPHKGAGDREIAWNRRAPLPDEEGMVERFVEAMWPVCTAHRLEAATSAGARYAVTGDVVRDLARAALCAINGGEP